jgi:hypothetical protein
VHSIKEITTLEGRYSLYGEPGLGAAYAALLAQWEDGADDKEICLRLMFLAWYSCSEPSFLTGLPECPKAGLFANLFEHVGGEHAIDSETMFVVGLMASLFPHCCGDNENDWTEIGARLTKRYQSLSSVDRLQVSYFDGRGEYGKYFAHMLTGRA